MQNDADQQVIRHVTVIAAMYADETNYVETCRTRPSYIIGRALVLAGYPMSWHSVVYAWMYDKRGGEL